MTFIVFFFFQMPPFERWYLTNLLPSENVTQGHFIVAMHKSRLMCDCYKKCLVSLAFLKLGQLRCLAMNSALQSKYCLGRWSPGIRQLSFSKTSTRHKCQADIGSYTPFPHYVLPQQEVKGF